jgi:murein DD-endopeptidase MepM/ murein hydrolase activator NlpD
LLALLLAFALTAAPKLPAVPPGGPTAFLWPAQGTITTPFVPGGHPGIDIGILRSLRVTAAAEGRVLSVGAPRGFEGYGLIVLVDVGGGYSALYAHLSRAWVRPGEIVEAGQGLGVAGCTGYCTGTHLHFEVRLRGEAVNPMRIPFRAAPAEASFAMPTRGHAGFAGVAV